VTDWNPKDEMTWREYLKFKRGEWVEVSTVPQWVREASNPPPKTSIPFRGSVSVVFTGDSLQYKVVTKRVPPRERGVGSEVRGEYYTRIRPD
jgi:hypothetical protein